MNIAMTVLDNPLRYYFNIWKYYKKPICYHSDSDSNSDELSIEIYGNVSKEVIEKVEELEVPYNYFKTTGVNYVRDFYKN